MTDPDIDPYASPEAQAALQRDRAEQYRELSKLTTPERFDLMFGRVKQVKCIHCNRPKGDHKAHTFNCPIGPKHKTYGYTQFSQNDVFTEK